MIHKGVARIDDLAAKSIANGIVSGFRAVPVLQDCADTALWWAIPEMMLKRFIKHRLPVTVVSAIPILERYCAAGAYATSLITTSIHTLMVI